VSRRKKTDGWGGLSGTQTPQERRAALPDVEQPHGGSGRYKDKKHWCRGKIGGRRHTGVIVLDRWRWKPDEVPSCYWTFRYRYSHGGKTLRDRWLAYSCNHKIVCSNDKCRKVLEWRLDVERCPYEPKVFFDHRTRESRPYEDVLKELESEDRK
jgi:hypothetical protein